MAKRVKKWVVLTCILFAATVALAVAAVQILVVTLNSHFTLVPPWSSSTVLAQLPRAFFAYLYLLSGLLVGDLMTVQRLRREIHSSKADSVHAATESPQLPTS